MGRPDFLVEMAVCRYERQKSQTEIVNAMPLYPTEAVLWDDNQVPKVHYTGGPPVHCHRQACVWSIGMMCIAASTPFVSD